MHGSLRIVPYLPSPPREAGPGSLCLVPKRRPTSSEPTETGAKMEAEFVKHPPGTSNRQAVSAPISRPFRKDSKYTQIIGLDISALHSFQL